MSALVSQDEDSEVLFDEGWFLSAGARSEAPPSALGSSLKAENKNVLRKLSKVDITKALSKNNRKGKPLWYQTRQRKVTKGQKKILNQYWPTYGKNNKEGLEYNKERLCYEPISLESWFGNGITKFNFEIGFGIGTALVQLALNNPTENFVGIEIYRAGHAHVIKEIVEKGISNIRLLGCDAIKFFSRHLQEKIGNVYVMFPDPWMRSNVQRRLISEEFVVLLHSHMTTGSSLFISTDRQDYADYVQKIVAQVNGKGGGDGAKICRCKSYVVNQRPDWRPQTRYECIGISEKRDVHDFEFKMM
jgi:tRNA (guanine-N7-)-methyltransferase